MTPAEALQNIDVRIDRLTNEIEHLMCERREIINRENLNKGSASALAPSNRTPRTSPLC